jgi:hypothetical protein
MNSILYTVLFSDWVLISSRIIGLVLLVPTWQFWRGLHRYRVEGRSYNIVTLYQTAFITTLSVASLIGSHFIVIVPLVWISWKKIGYWFHSGKLNGRLQIIRIVLGCFCAFIIHSSMWLLIVIPLVLEAVYRFSLRYNSIYTNADGKV